MSRFHSLDEIGGINGDFEINFDPIGRLTVVQNGSYSVLNDRDWIYITEFDDNTEVLHSVLQLSETEAYYGASGSWGRLIRTREGSFTPEQLATPNRPIWSKSSNYLILFEFADKVCFANWNGIVVWDKQTSTNHYFEVVELADAFAMGEELFVTSALDGLKRVDFERKTLIPMQCNTLEEQLIYHHATFDKSRLLCATRRFGISLFDGEKLIPWENDLDSLPDPLITSICRLPEGNFAISLDGRGLFILNPEGEIISAYTTTEFQNIEQIISKEPGILWFSTDSGIQQVFYGSRVTLIDRRLGVPINWPQIVSWRGRTIIASNGRLFESNLKNPKQTLHFDLVENQPAWGTWGIACKGDTLLVGNRTGVYLRTGESEFKVILEGFPADRMLMPTDDLCYVIGKEAITMLQKTDGEWKECSERIEGLGYPTVTHLCGGSAWIELGVHRVARISYKNGILKSQLFDEFPWKQTGWIHVGSVGDLVILCSPTEGRLFFDESKGEFVPTPPEWEFLENFPYLIGRLKQDASGRIWVSHFQGISQLVQTEGEYSLETSGFEFVRASYPLINIVDGKNVWFNTGTNLFHVNPETQKLPFKTPAPTIVTIIDQTTQEEILNYDQKHQPLQLDYRHNNLGIRLFAGSYAIRNPRYNIRVESQFLNWSTFEADSNVSLPNLREGNYEIRCQLSENSFSVSDPLTIRFQILPPWYRSYVAYFLYFLASLAVIYLLIHWSLHRTRRHNRRLTKLVNERTNKLEETMDKLAHETRNAATLAERDRLAGEIHDSVQQGLTGLMIHLDGMLRSPIMSEALRPSIGTAKKMLDYTRKEVQHALLDMESPLLEDSDITRALKRIADLIPSESTQIELKTTGEPVPIPSYHAHQLLRICQEAMTNAVRHGHAKQIILRLHYTETSLSLKIEDDGNGFDPSSSIDQTHHFGLRGMRNRAKSMGSELIIISAPNDGAVVSIELSLDELIPTDADNADDIKIKN